jgi:hypothetical protein
MNQTNQNNIAPFAEEQVFEEKQNKVQGILNRFKQPIPQGFVELKVEEGNYLCSTNPKWTNKSLCERYGFYSIEGEWIQIDILHDLMEELELEKGQEINYPIFLSPEVLQRKEICKGITIENEFEIFLDKPLTINSLEKSLTEWITKINQLTTRIKEFKENTETNQTTISDLQKEKEELTSLLNLSETQINNLKD